MAQLIADTPFFGFNNIPRQWNPSISNRRSTLPPTCHKNWYWWRWDRSKKVHVYSGVSSNNLDRHFFPRALTETRWIIAKKHVSRKMQNLPIFLFSLWMTLMNGIRDHDKSNPRHKGNRLKRTDRKKATEKGQYIWRIRRSHRGKSTYFPSREISLYPRTVTHAARKSNNKHCRRKAIILGLDRKMFSFTRKDNDLNYFCSAPFFSYQGTQKLTESVEVFPDVWQLNSY